MSKVVVGQQFDRLVVAAEESRGPQGGRVRWRCRCDCGRETVASERDLLSGHSTSCGCNRTRAIRERYLIDLAGRVFGRLRVVEYAGDGRWKCDCACGNECLVGGYDLTKPRKGVLRSPTRSCGCLRSEFGKKQGGWNRTHGMKGTPEYGAWRGMLDRCCLQSNISYPGYGGRGVKVCERWLHSFENFFADMGSRPSRRHSLDRKDTNGDYSPGNCRWATKKEQAQNRRSSLQVEFQGRTQPLGWWADEYGIANLLLWKRLQQGWPVGAAITTPPGVRLCELGLTHGEGDREWVRKNRIRARLRWAVRSGRLSRPAHCEHPGCKAAKVEAHHHKGYDDENATDVVWLCRSHHEEAEAAAPLVG